MNIVKHINTVNVIILSCVLVFLLREPLSALRLEMFFLESPLFHPLQFLSYMFLHGGLTHLLFNMLGLWMFGSAVESVWGWRRFSVFYLLCGLGSALIYQGFNYYQFNQAMEPVLAANIARDEIQSLLNAGRYFTAFPSMEQAAIIYTSPVVGASGALYGVLVAFACLFPNHKVMLIFLPVPIAAKFFVPALIGLDLISEFTGVSIFGGNIAHAAHVGGAVTGIILMLFFMRKKPKALI